MKKLVIICLFGLLTVSMFGQERSFYFTEFYNVESDKGEHKEMLLTDRKSTRLNSSH